MAALPLFYPEAHSRWSTWVGVGAGLIVMGFLLDYLLGAIRRPTGAPGEGVLVISTFFFASGVAFIGIGLVLRRRGRAEPSAAGTPP